MLPCSSSAVPWGEAIWHVDGGASVAGVPLDAASGDGVDDLGDGVYPADAGVMGVGNEQVALAITRNSHGM